MPPIRLVHWGDPAEEAPELQPIQDAWRDAEAKFRVESIEVVDSDPEAAHRALKIACEDANTQVVYFTCHGVKDGFLYSAKNGPLVTYKEFSMWLAGMRPATRRGGDPKPIRALVLGSCEAMSPVLSLEHYMPDWVAEVIGFKTQPTPSDVIDLMTGVALNLANWGKEIGKGIIAAAEGTSGQGWEAQWAAIEKAFHDTDAVTPFDATQRLALDQVKNVAHARRNPDTWEWVRVERP